MKKITTFYYSYKKNIFFCIVFVGGVRYEKNNFSFKGTCYISYYCTGMFLDVSVSATASNNNNETMYLLLIEMLQKRILFIVMDKLMNIKIFS